MLRGWRSCRMSCERKEDLVEMNCFASIAESPESRGG